MSMSGDDAYVLAMDYVDETLKGGGALKGDDGKSAYQSWLDLGNTGTEEDFINSLKGEKGQVGEKGETGNNGKSSYEIWLDNGNVGTEQDFLDSLKGEGADGFSPVITENSNNTDEDYRLDIETKESKFTTPNLKADIRKNIAEHNTSPDSHNDIRIFLNELNNRLNTLANSDDETLDEMKEVVAYIKDNRSLIESITTTKVNVADIIDNLTTNVSNKPLSASQGVVIKNLIDTLQSELTAHINNFDIHVTPNDKTNWDNATDKINNLKVGGRNLLLNTANEIIVDGSNDTSGYKYDVLYNNLEIGETYAFSAELSVEGSEDKRVTLAVFNIYSRELILIGNLTADEKRHNITFEVTNNTPCLIIYSGVYGSTSGVKATCHHAKLEKGNVATDWTPAPEDKADKADLAKYLPLTGGRMTGIISTNNDLAKVTPSPTGLIGGGHAQGIIFLNKDDAEFGTFGAMGTGGTFEKFYIGFGNNAWENGNGLEIKPASIKWKGSNLVTDLDLTIDAIQGLRAELDELRNLITNS